jgi:hypothetical protein
MMRHSRGGADADLLFVVEVRKEYATLPPRSVVSGPSAV